MDKYGYIGRKKRVRTLKEEPAIIIVAFGSTNRGKVALDVFEEALKKELPGREIFWAFTSHIIRARTGCPGLAETLAKVESQGYRKAVVQPLHVFPGTEYQEVLETCNYFPGLRVITGETLFHRWSYMVDVLEVMEREFISDGLNLLAAHGTPFAASPANTIYLGLEGLLKKYTNALLATVEGVPHKDVVMKEISRNYSDYKKVKIIPMMYIAGLHVEDDLIGDDEDSWKCELKKIGFDDVECASTTHNGEEFPKGLGFYPEVNQFFIDRLVRTLELEKYY